MGYGYGSAADSRRDEWRSWRPAERDNREINRANAWDRQAPSSANPYESSRFASHEPSEYGSPVKSSYYGRGPKGYRRSDERIREEASETLQRDPYIDASEIEVDVKDGVVTLRGHTEDRRQKRMAEDAIEHLSGVRDVRNELMIDQSFFQRAKEALFGGSTQSISDRSTDTSKGDLVTDGHTAQTKRNPRH